MVLALSQRLSLLGRSPSPKIFLDNFFNFCISLILIVKISRFIEQILLSYFM